MSARWDCWGKGTANMENLDLWRQCVEDGHSYMVYAVTNDIGSASGDRPLWFHIKCSKCHKTYTAYTV